MLTMYRPKNIFISNLVRDRQHLHFGIFRHSRNAVKRNACELLVYILNLHFVILLCYLFTFVIRAEIVQNADVGAIIRVGRNLLKLSFLYIY